MVVLSYERLFDSWQYIYKKNTYNLSDEGGYFILGMCKTLTNSSRSFVALADTSVTVPNTQLLPGQTVFKPQLCWEHMCTCSTATPHCPQAGMCTWVSVHSAGSTFTCGGFLHHHLTDETWLRLWALVAGPLWGFGEDVWIASSVSMKNLTNYQLKPAKRSHRIVPEWEIPLLQQLCQYSQSW